MACGDTSRSKRGRRLPSNSSSLSPGAIGIIPGGVGAGEGDGGVGAGDIPPGVIPGAVVPVGDITSGVIPGGVPMGDAGGAAPGLGGADGSVDPIGGSVAG